MFKRIQIFLLLFFISFVLQAENITVMSINAQNLFDTLDDPEKDDKAFLPIELKQSKKHKNSCNSITVNRWRMECFFQDWNEETKNAKLQKAVSSPKAAVASVGPAKPSAYFSARAVGACRPGSSWVA